MILYFSGTGNSNYVAKRIADALGDEILNLNDRIKSGDTLPVETGERGIIVTPTYAWRIPRIVRDWLRKTELRGAKRSWFVMTCGSEIGNADKYNRELCAEKAISCMGAAQIVMPENYIAMFSAPQADEARQIVAKAESSIDRAIAAIQANQPFVGFDGRSVGSLDAGIQIYDLIAQRVCDSLGDIFAVSGAGKV